MFKMGGKGIFTNLSKIIQQPGMKINLLHAKYLVTFKTNNQYTLFGYKLERNCKSGKLDRIEPKRRERSKKINSDCE
jgi:hypothetical protein